MKWILQKRWLAVMLGVVLTMVTYCAWNRAPTFTFVEFQDADGERVAVFKLENRSGGTILYDFPSTRPCLYRIRRTDGWQLNEPPPWVVFNGHISFFGNSKLLPGEHIVFSVPLTRRDGVPITRPFQIGFQYWEWNAETITTLGMRLRRWIGDSLWEPRKRVIWSQTITP